MKKFLIVMSILSLFVLAGCAKEATETLPSVNPEIITPTGAGEAVVPEEGDIVIPIN